MAILLRGVVYFSGELAVPLPVQLFFYFFLFPSAKQQHLKGFPEGFVAEGIANGVNSAVDVAQPVTQVPQGDRNTFVTEGGDQDHDVIRSPRDDKGQENGTQGLGCFPLLDQDHSLPFGHLVAEVGIKAFWGRVLGHWEGAGHDFHLVAAIVGLLGPISLYH